MAETFISTPKDRSIHSDPLNVKGGFVELPDRELEEPLQLGRDGP